MLKQLEEEIKQKVALDKRVDKEFDHLLAGKDLNKTQKEVIQHQINTYQRFKNNTKGRLMYQYYF